MAAYAIRSPKADTDKLNLSFRVRHFQAPRKINSEFFISRGDTLRSAQWEAENGTQETPR